MAKCVRIDDIFIERRASDRCFFEFAFAIARYGPQNRLCKLKQRKSMKSACLLIICCALSLAAFSQNAHTTDQLWVEVVECDPLEELNELEKFTHYGLAFCDRYRSAIPSPTAVVLTLKPIDQRLFILQQTLLI